MKAKNSLLRLLHVFGWAFLLLAGNGCSTIRMPVVPDIIKVQYPSNMPRQVVTNFNEALACMDDLMLVNEVEPLMVASDGLVNYTSTPQISNGGKEMLINALSRMSIRSKGVTFVAYGREMPDILSLNEGHPDRGHFVIPDYFIRGGVTQYLKNLWYGNEGDGTSVSIDNGDLIDHGTFYSILNAEDISGSNSNDTSYQAVTLDMSMGYISTLQIIPGVSSANTLAFTGNTSNSRGLDLTIGDLGYNYHVTSIVGTDINQALRSLIQVGAIELIGKIQGLPYWRCLANAGKVEERDELLREEFVNRFENDKSELIRFVQTALRDLHYYQGDLNGQLDLTTRKALQQYQQHMGILATGTLGYDTFRMLNTFTPTRDEAYAPWWLNHVVTPTPVAPQSPVATK